MGFHSGTWVFKILSNIYNTVFVKIVNGFNSFMEEAPII